MVERQLPKLNVAGSSPVYRSSKNARFAMANRAFLSDAFLRNEMHTVCVMRAYGAVMHAFGARRTHRIT